MTSDQPSALTQQSRVLGINVPQSHTNHLHTLVRQEIHDCWQSQNAGAIAAYNHHLERDGVWGAEWRKW